MTEKRRMVEFDLIRVVAIVLIVIIHTIDFAGLWKGSVLSAYLGVLGVGLFFFMSGFLLSAISPKITNRNEIAAFLKRRFLRIFPLYWLALALILVMRPTEYDIVSITVNVFGLQGIFSPLPGILDMSLWFIGVIVLFYLLFVVLTYLSKSSIERLITFAAISFLGLGCLRFFLGIIDGKFFEYYLVFIAGIVVQKCDFLSTDRLKVSMMMEIGGIIVCWVFILFMDSMMPNDIQGMGLTAIVQAGTVSIVRIVLILCTAMFFLQGLRKVQFGTDMTRLLKNAALASYAVYLFHLQFAEIFNNTVCDLVGQQTIAHQLSILFILIPLLFIFAYYAQMAQDRVFRILDERKMQC